MRGKKDHVNNLRIELSTFREVHSAYFYANMLSERHNQLDQSSFMVLRNKIQYLIHRNFDDIHS